jgi:molybdopterin converting factor subunit 1
MDGAMVDVEVLFFARARELAGRPQARLSVPEGATVDAAVRRIAEEFPALAAYLGVCRVALDEEFASGTERIGARSVLAVLPPVSGG